MTDNPITHPFKQLFCAPFLCKVVFSAFVIFRILLQPAYGAEQEWWFDVEVILFERNLDVASISEKFEQSQLVHSDSENIDLLTPYLHPDLSYLRAGLNYCRASKRQALKNQYEQDFAFPKPTVKENDSDAPKKDGHTFDEISNTAAEAVSETDNDLVVASEDTPVENFEYKVATTDIFAKSDQQNSLTESQETKSATHLNSGQINSETLVQQDHIEKNAEIEKVRPPIHVEFIEWQIPNELPCAYSEQVDASFASIDYLKEAQSMTQPSNLITHVPVVIDGVEWPQKRGAILLPQSSMRMNALFEKIKKQRDIAPILHVNWRQKVVFGRENAQTIRLFAGQNYAEKFDDRGLPIVPDTDALVESLNNQADEFYIPEQELALLTSEEQQALFSNVNDSEAIVTEDIFAKIDHALSDNSEIDFQFDTENTRPQISGSGASVLKELWQLDGGITVYLRRVGRIPYLHIDSNLDYRQPIYDPKKATPMSQLTTSMSVNGALLDSPPKQPNYLQSVNFNQLRRVISKQVHYFDHPLFGMVVLIHRYRWPEIEADSDANENEVEN